MEIRGGVQRRSETWIYILRQLWPKGKKVCGGEMKVRAESALERRQRKRSPQEVIGGEEE